VLPESQAELGKAKKKARSSRAWGFQVVVWLRYLTRDRCGALVEECPAERPVIRHESTLALRREARLFYAR
jgi:hypothetical protein